MGAIIYFAPRQPVRGSGWGIGHPTHPDWPETDEKTEQSLFYLPWETSGPLLWLRQLLGHKRNNWQQTHPTIFSPSTSDNCFYQGPLLYFSEENQFQTYINGERTVDVRMGWCSQYKVGIIGKTFASRSLLDLLESWWSFMSLTDIEGSCRSRSQKCFLLYCGAVSMEVSSADWLFNQSFPLL